MPATISPGHHLARALASLIEAHFDGDGPQVERDRRELVLRAHALAADPILGPALARHLPSGTPASEVSALAWILAVMQADAVARAATLCN